MRPYHHGNLRTVLLEQAEATLEADGIDALSLRELARAAGVSHGAPRRHFPDRQALLDALAGRGYERLGAQLRTVFDASPPTLDARVTALARTYAAFATRSGALLALMFAGKHSTPGGPVQRASEAALDPLFDMIRDAAGAEGVVGNIDDLGMAVFAAAHGIAVLVNAGLLPAHSLDHTVDDTTARILRGSTCRAATG